MVSYVKNYFKEEFFVEGLQLTILTQDDLERRYNNLKDTTMARLTDLAVAEGYSIGILQYNGLSLDYVPGWSINAGRALASHFKGHSYKIGVFTDLSEVEKDKLYFSFKTKKCVQIAHSLSGCDSDGFIYNT